MDIPKSMVAELGAWNGGAGIDLQSWIGGTGNFSLAVGYATLFWPDLVEFEGYILPAGFSLESLRGFEKQDGSTRKSVEWVMNHVHLADIHAFREDASADKLVILGNVLREIYAAKLAWKFPHLPCKVEFYLPDDRDDLIEYQLSFWQKVHDVDEASRH